LDKGIFIVSHRFVIKPKALHKKSIPLERHHRSVHIWSWIPQYLSIHVIVFLSSTQIQNNNKTSNFCNGSWFTPRGVTWVLYILSISFLVSKFTHIRYHFFNNNNKNSHVSSGEDVYLAFLLGLVLIEQYFFL
jgi:hypothetical protein